MLWQEDDDQIAQKFDNGDVIDVIYRLRGKTLPIDYAHDLLVAIHKLAPWIAEDSAIGISLLIAGEEGNGWYRENNPDQVLYLPRRTRLLFRIPKQFVEKAKLLVGESLTLGSHQLTLESLDEVNLSSITTLYARHVVDNSNDETEFLKVVMQELGNLNIHCKKMLCGKARAIKSDQNEIQTRSLMLADLSHEDAIKLQQKGIGPHRNLGCGLFVPHKAIK